MRFERRAGSCMRVVISAPRKSGGAYLRCLLSMAYDLKAPPVSAPEPADSSAIAAWLADLPASSVSTCDLPLSDLSSPATAANVSIVGVIRHPFDLFVSNHEVAQQRAARGRSDDDGDRGWSVLAGEPLESDVTRQYALAEFASEVSAQREWRASGSAVLYEGLLDDPAAVLTALASLLGPLSDGQVEHAIALCPAENVVVSRPGRGRRMPTLPPGTWRDRLPAPLLTSLQEAYGDDVAALGYDAS